MPMEVNPGKACKPEPIEVEFSELLRCGARFFSLLSRSLDQLAEDCQLEERIADLEENLRRLKKQR